MSETFGLIAFFLIVCVVIIGLGFIIGTHFYGLFIWSVEDEKNVFISSDIEISELQWITINENKNKFSEYATLFRLKNNDTVWLRIVEPTDYGASLPIHGEMIINKTYTNHDIIFGWTVNPCIPTTIIAIITNNTHKWAETTRIPQKCMCM